MAVLTNKSNDTLSGFYELVHQVHDLDATQALMGWDLETYMPESAASIRSKQMATLATLSHQKMTGQAMANSLTTLRQDSVFKTLSSIDQALVREVQERHDKYQKIPETLLQAMVHTTAEAHQVWVSARKNRSFKQFQPVLGQIIKLNQQMAEAIGYEDSPYNALLDEYEKGLTVRQLDLLFERLKTDIVLLLRALHEISHSSGTGCLTDNAPYAAADQLHFATEILGDMGFCFRAGRLDLSAHPFTSGSSIQDVRLTTRLDEQDVLSGLFSALHEGGHGLYEQGINPELARTLLAEGTSLGIHESQSRLWENMVGRSKPFWQHYFPKLQTVFPQLNTLGFDAFYQAVNTVSTNSLIRVESDEVSYNLHIILRYEIERALIEGSMTVEEVPEAWNAKMQDYLGVTPKHDGEGALQDIHWSHGSFGYFPTYTLGNLYSAQIFNTAKQQLPNLEEQLAAGQLLPLKQWLNQQIHWVGKTETAETIVKRVTQEPLNPQYFTNYLWDKYGTLFNIQRP
jgi:carboxypeptidase Taq